VGTETHRCRTGGCRSARRATKQKQQQQDALLPVQWPRLRLQPPRLGSSARLQSALSRDPQVRRAHLLAFHGTGQACARAPLQHGTPNTFTLVPNKTPLASRADRLAVCTFCRCFHRTHLADTILSCLARHDAVLAQNWRRKWGVRRSGTARAP
jgi:hypothetical protein